MRKAANRFLLYALLAIFVLLTALLGVINGINFTIEAQDADNITQMIAEQNGELMPLGVALPEGGLPDGTLPDGTHPRGVVPQVGFPQGEIPQGFPQGELPEGEVPQMVIPGLSFDPNSQDAGALPSPDPNGVPMQMPDKAGGVVPFMPFGNNPFGWVGAAGVDSPELGETMRYFTVRIDQNGEGSIVVYRISAVTEEEAITWAQSLKNEKTGWTNGSYRYRVYESLGSTFVTVIDQSRELLPSYRILLISVIGELVGLVISFFVLQFASKRLFQPIEEADRKQKRFIADAESEFKVPLTVISANTEQIEKENGPTDTTRAIHRQVNKMTDLVRKLGRLALFQNDVETVFSLTDVVNTALESERLQFEEKGITLNTSIAPNVALRGSREQMQSVMRELIENTLKYARTEATFSLSTEQARVKLKTSNDTSLPNGSYEQIFDRFTTLENGTTGSGLGLAHVKEIVKLHDGRVRASVENGVFTLRIDL